MNKQKSHLWCRSLILCAISAATLPLSAFAAPQDKATSTTSTAETFTTSADTVQATPSQTIVDVLDVPQKLAKFKGGDAGLYNLIASKMKYPPIAQECGIGGRILVQFVVECDGSVSNVNIKKSVSEPANMRQVENQGPDVVVKHYKKKEGDEQYLNEAEFYSSKKALEAEAIHVIQCTSGKWEAAEHEGKKVRSRFTFPIMFRLR